MIHGDEGSGLVIVGRLLREVELSRRLEEVSTVVGHFSMNLGLQG